MRFSECDVKRIRRAEQQRADAGFVDTDRVSNLPVAVALVSQQQHPAIALGQFIQSASDCLAPLVFEQVLIGDGRPAGRERAGMRLNEMEAALRGALVISEEIVRNRSHPATCIVGERCPLVQSHEYLLRQIVGKISVTGQSMEGAEQGWKLLIEQRAKRLLETGRPFVSLVSPGRCHRRGETGVVQVVLWGGGTRKLCR